MTSRDRSPHPDPSDALPARAEAVRAHLAAIETRVFSGRGVASLDEQLAALREVALTILGPVDG